MPRAQMREIRTGGEDALPRKQLGVKRSKKVASDLDGFLAAQRAAFEDGRAYLEARRRRPRK